MSISKDDITRVKGRGFLLNRGTECFSGRVVPVAGAFSAADLKSIAECAEKFGSGQIIFTSRLTAEIVGIPYEKIEEAEKFLEERQLYFGGTGAKVRPITACKGTTCVYGNIDTQAIAGVLHDKFYIGLADVKMPHKFKIAVGGCPNSCMKPSLNDVGIEGVRVIKFDSEKCRGCKKCAVAANCPSKAVKFNGNIAEIDSSICTNCGVCVGKCPFGAVPKEAEARCRIFVGGTWGKKQRMGTALSRTFTPDEVPEIVERVFLWYRENGYIKERLGAAVDRIGVENLEKSLFAETDSVSDLIARRDEIFALPLKERPQA